MNGDYAGANTANRQTVARNGQQNQSSVAQRSNQSQQMRMAARPTNLPQNNGQPSRPIQW
jgi:hypothetical protein